MAGRHSELQRKEVRGDGGGVEKLLLGCRGQKPFLLQWDLGKEPLALRRLRQKTTFLVVRGSMD